MISSSEHIARGLLAKRIRLLGWEAYQQVIVRLVVCDVFLEMKKRENCNFSMGKVCVMDLD